MINTRFEEYKLKRELKRNGTKLTFYRRQKNEFGLLSGDVEEVATFTCLYHESNSYISESVGDATVSRNVKTPMLLCLVQDITFSHLAIGDYVNVPNIVTGEMKTYYVTGITDISDFGIIADVSLEVIDDGTVC